MKRIFVSAFLTFTLILNTLLFTACGLGRDEIDDILGNLGTDQGGQGGQGGQDGQGGQGGDFDEVVLLVDASYSLGGAREQVNGFVESVINANGGAKVGVVTFGYDQVYAVELSDDTADGYARYLEAPLPDTTATDIESALNYAASLFTVGARSRIILISDGAETDGDSVGAAKAAASKGITVDTVCITGQKAEKEAQLLSLTVPDDIVVGEAFAVEVTLQSSYSGEATVTLLDNGIEGIRQQVELVSGPQTVSIPCTLDLPGLHGFSVKLESENDTLALNNTYTAYVNIPVFDGILVIESIEDESEYLCSMLDEEYRLSVVNVGDVDSMPKTVNEIREYDQVILCNVSYADMPVGFDELLYSYVYDFGGGLFTVCGVKEAPDGGWAVNAYTREDMLGTVYQELLPVEIIEYTPPAAVVIIIDDDGSMLSDHPDDEGDSPFHYAKQGAVACLDSLTERDLVGVMSLSDASAGLLELIPCTHRAEILDAIDGIGIGSDVTVLSTALDLTGRALTSLAEVERRHVVIVTDGRVEEAEEKYALYLKNNAECGITTSIVGIGCDPADADRMKRVLADYAAMSEESFYGVTDVYDIPVAMRADLASPVIKEVCYDSFMPTLGAEHTITSGINEDQLPVLDGFYGVKAKKGAEVIINGPYTPIYTRWSCGAGAVGSFACDLNGSFSSEFIASAVGEELINRMVKDLMPTREVSHSTVEVVIEGDNYRREARVITDLEDGQYVEMTVTDPYGENGIDDIRRISSDGAGSVFSFSIREPGVYEIRVQKRDASGLLLEQTVCYGVFSYSKEYDAFYDGDGASERLAEIAEQGNGRVILSPGDLLGIGAPAPDDE